jgi:predicted alpha/beta hydrolase family esterase
MLRAMKHAVIIHGWEGTPADIWFPWLATQLKAHDFNVDVPAMPDTTGPQAGAWDQALAAAVGQPTADTYLIGHSLGAITILRYLETAPAPIGGAVFVAGFGQDLAFSGYQGQLAGFFDHTLDWDRIRTQARVFAAIHSDNDPFVDGANLALFRERLGATGLLLPGRGHFGVADHSLELPEALDQVLAMSA